MFEAGQSASSLPTTNDQRPTTARRLRRRAVWAWAFYDFANSPFATTVMAVVFNVYFARVVARSAPLHGDTIWAILIAVSTLASGIISPVWGALADRRSWKKISLAACALTGSISTIGLTASQEGTILLSCLLFLAASLSFSCSLAFYNAFLNDLADDKNIGRVSGFGWAMGYAGGGLCLALNLLMIERPEFFGLPAHNQWPVRLTFAVVGLWWAVFSIPILLWVEEKPKARQPGGEPFFASLGYSLKAVAQSIKSAGRTNRNLFTFLIAYLLYNDGIETVLVMAGVFASEMLLMGPGEIVGCFLMIQFVAFFGAFGFGRLADRWSNKKALMLSLGLWTAVLIWAILMKSKLEFWLAGAVIAVVMGASQSLSRSLFGKLVPKGSEAEFYGFLNLSSKVSATLGPLTYGLSRQITGSPRIGILSMLIFFVLGQLLLTHVKEPKKT
ncbi:MAG: MFS transporter [Elusimicrobia bacterium]|nr:MFS transporter [Elusimicrobiota bacterium]